MLLQQTVDCSGKIKNREETEKKYLNLYIVDKRLFLTDYFVREKQDHSDLLCAHVYSL